MYECTISTPCVRVCTVLAGYRPAYMYRGTFVKRDTVFVYV